MKSDKTILIGVLVLVFPLLVLGGMIGKAVMDQQVGQQVWQLKIMGYDPRDILYGHYIEFRYDWNIDESADDTAALSHGQSVCLCVNPGDEGYKHPKVHRIECKSPESKSCVSVMDAYYKNGGTYMFNKNEMTERYFIPEENSQKLDKKLRAGDGEFTMEVMAHKNRSVTVRNLYVDGVPLPQYLRTIADDAQE